MNEFDYDAMQKKKLCASARKQKNGSKSRKCSLPSDHLTAAQMRAKNGPVTTCNLNEPMRWEDFKALSADLQREYIKGLHSRFDVGLGVIGTELFGLSSSGLQFYVKRHGIEVNIRGVRLNRERRAVWEHWLNRTDGKEAVEEEVVTEEPQDIEAVEPEPVEHEEPGVPTFGMSAMRVEWCGEFNALAFMAQLSRLPMPEGLVKIRLEVEAWT